MAITPNTALEPTPLTPVNLRFGFLVGGSHRRRGSAFGRSAAFMGSVMATAKVEPLDMKLEVVVLGVFDVDGNNQIVQGERS